MPASSLTHDVATPERVSLTLPVAGVGSRAMAWLLDVALLGTAAVLAYFVFTLAVPDPLAVYLGLSDAARVVGALSLVAGLFGYWTAWEMAWDGQTPGKRLLRIRVVRADGAPVTPLQSALRNLMRTVDFLPFCYPVGLLTMLADPRHRRLGDIVAGTLLVRDERVDLSRYAVLASPPTAEARGLSVADTELLTGFLARFETLDPEVRRSLGAALAARLGVDARGDAEALRARLQGLLGARARGALSAFVAERRAAWEELEVLLERLRRRTLRYEELGALDRLYRRASADLARSGAAFTGTEVHRFLNQLCGRAYAAIYRPRGSRLARVGRFFAVAYPRAVQRTLPYTLASLGLLGLGAVLGAVVAATVPGGAQAVLAPELLELIERRELWTDTALSSHTPTELAVLIFTNNLRVALGAFAAGITAGVGTVLLVLYNGVHVGAVVAACAQADLLGGILGFMAAHGPVELSLLSITGGAGLVIGHALIEPGERSRAAWVRERAVLGVQLVLGSAPFLVAVGVVEGFVSPGAFFPWPLKAGVGALALVAFWRYALGRRTRTAPKKPSVP